MHPTLNQSAKGSGGVGSSNQELFSQGGAYLVPGQPIPIQDGREIEKHQNGMGVGNSGDPAYTIDTTGAQAAAIPFRKSKRACSTTDHETWVEADASNTLNNFDLGDTRTTHAVVQPVAIQGTIIGRGENAGPQGVGATEGGPMFTLTKTDVHGVCQPQVYENHAQDSRVSGPLDVAPTVAAKFGTGGGNVPLVGAMAVRRLTPVECERLQGFPDNWSRISWKGKPEEECPDGPRYKACGNSMAVPVMRWIGERIAAVDSTLSHNA